MLSFVFPPSALTAEQNKTKERDDTIERLDNQVKMLQIDLAQRQQDVIRLEARNLIMSNLLTNTTRRANVEIDQLRDEIDERLALITA